MPLELQAYVIYDNKCNPNFTVLEVEVQDYPGALLTFSSRSHWQVPLALAHPWHIGKPQRAGHLFLVSILLLQAQGHEMAAAVSCQATVFAVGCFSQPRHASSADGWSSA